MSKITIDRAGRVIIPKAVRDRLRLEPGDELEIETSGEEIMLRPSRPEAPLIKEKGIWVHCSEVPLSYSIVDLIDDAREERISELLR